jgi:hypothetical protein
MRTYGLALAAAAVLVGAAVVHGNRTDRWGTPADLQAAVDRLQAVPLTVGDWDGVATELPKEQVAAANVAGYVSRKFTHRYDRTVVNLLILCGRPGPVAVHPPEVCYGANGFAMGPVQAEAVGDAAALWQTDFTRGTGATVEKLRVRWAWNDGRGWAASGSPRTDFARSPLLYKMYLVRSLPAKADDATPAPELDLLKQLLPALQAVTSQP